MPIVIDCCDVIIFVGRTVAKTLNYDVFAILKIVLELSEDNDARRVAIITE